MRKTLSKVYDVLAAVKTLRPAQEISVARNGMPLLPNRNPSKPVTPELVNQLLDELP
ncbi:MAG: hypothetical protein ABSB19_00865 [Methylomonas sp.]